MTSAPASLRSFATVPKLCASYGKPCNSTTGHPIGSPLRRISTSSTPARTVVGLIATAQVYESAYCQDGRSAALDVVPAASYRRQCPSTDLCLIRSTRQSLGG